MKVINNNTSRNPFLHQLVLVVLLLACIGTCYADKKPPKNLFREKFSRKEIVKDISYIKSALSIHPSLYESVSKEELDRKFSELESQLPDSLTRREFYNRVAPIVASVKDGHTGLSLPNDFYYMHLDNGGTFFPFSVYMKNGRLFAGDSGKGEIPANSEIVSVNSIPVDRIVGKLLDNMGAFSLQYKYRTIEERFGKLLFDSYNFKDQFVISYIDSDTGKENTVKVKGKDKDLSRSRGFNYRVLESKVGYLEINDLVIQNWNEYQKMDTVVNQLFDSIGRSGIKDLIIDLRNNLGGSELVAKLFLKHLTKKPYTMVRKEINYKLDRESRKFYRRQRRSVMNTLLFPLYPFFSWERHLYFSSKEIVDTWDIKERSPRAVPDSLFFYGNKYVVFNTRTFSSATEFANVFQHYGIAHTFGTETGCPVVQCGEAKSYFTPNVLLNIRVSSKKFWYPGSEDVEETGKNHGVIPDHIVEDDPFHFKDEKDPVIRSVFEFMRGRG
ncbi:MAG: S41 family peptidase [Marinifilaceae bacterium]